MTAIDVHQHVWPEEVLRGLEQRSAAPYARYASDSAWEITLAGEPSFTVSAESHGVESRAGAVLEDTTLDRAIVALSSPVGIEALPVGEATPLLDAWDAAARRLPATLEPWAAVCLEDPDPARVTAALDAGAVGLCLPGRALTSPQRIERLGPILELLERRLAPLFVHPGPGSGAVADWWSSVTDYVAELHAAWHAFAAWGRPAHPQLRVVFAALAGLAPLHSERSAARGGPAFPEPDPLVFYEPSSYGARALRAMTAAVGISQLVHGTDEPVVAPPRTRPLGPDAHNAMRTANAARLLGRQWSA